MASEQHAVSDVPIWMVIVLYFLSPGLVSEIFQVGGSRK